MIGDDASSPAVFLTADIVEFSFSTDSAVTTEPLSTEIFRKEILVEDSIKKL